MGIDSQRLRLSLKDGIVNIEEDRAGRRDSAEAQIEQAKRLIDAISTIKPGEVYPEVIGVAWKGIRS